MIPSNGSQYIYMNSFFVIYISSPVLGVLLVPSFLVVNRNLFCIYTKSMFFAIQNLSTEPGSYKVFPHLFCHVFMFGKGLSSIGRICQENPVVIRFFPTFFCHVCMFGKGQR